MRKFVYVSGVLFFMVWIVGALFKMLHWPGANVLIMTSVLLALVFIPVAAWYKYHKAG